MEIQQAFSVREIFKDFFNSENGNVPWQNERIKKKQNNNYNFSILLFT